MKNIELKNYRCFEKLPLDFSNKVNLLIGDNASGKTTLMRALSASLSSFFTGFSDENTRFTGLAKDDFRIIEAEASLLNEVPIKVDFEWLDSKAALELNSPKGRTLQEPLKPIKLKGAEIYKNMFEEKKQVLSLPLIASFSTSDIHSKRKISLEPFKKYDHKPSFGYYECLQGDGFLEYWTKRLLVLREANKGDLEINGVVSALMDALGHDGCHIITDVHIRPNQGKVYYYLNDNRVSDTDNLSDGLRRLINIVMDLAFRCMLLNKGFYGSEACKKTTGTVLIDEIDLHLHPTLQSVVMKGLQNAFPKLQFIITSHAPMVMTGISFESGNKIVKLRYSQTNGYEAIETKLFGMDASTIIETELNIPSRDTNVQSSLDEIFDLIDEENIEEARVKLNAMKEKFDGTLPELSKAESMITFLTARNDKDK